jgi:membrane protein YqaA with SNARE-associated domain
MFNQIGQKLIALATSLGPFGIFLVALGDSALVPLPQGVDALLIAQATTAPGTAYLAAALAVAGSVLGSLILYAIARRGGRVMLEKKISVAGIDKMQRQMGRYDALVLLLPTMIPLPLPMKLFVIGAGVFQMNLGRFVATIVFARCVRYFGVAFLAARYREETATFLRENALAGLGVALVLVALFYAVNRWSTNRLSAGDSG